ncbi:hypothetical protein E2I00_013456 [Balaenoptera physalus]|uniref:Uncharacterized protein n=1 Tax=Balaenoptera physalus TaxID=9770 RepID=A0A643BXR4_BALPH|nr:hypothetical protein E2I00_013456 [Balaenoptera physalus]
MRGSLRTLQDAPYLRPSCQPAPADTPQTTCIDNPLTQKVKRNQTLKRVCDPFQNETAVVIFFGYAVNHYRKGAGVPCRGRFSGALNGTFDITLEVGRAVKGPDKLLCMECDLPGDVRPQLGKETTWKTNDNSPRRSQTVEPAALEDAASSPTRDHGRGDPALRPPDAAPATLRTRVDERVDGGSSPAILWLPGRRQEAAFATEGPEPLGAPGAMSHYASLLSHELIAQVPACTPRPCPLCFPVSPGVPGPEPRAERRQVRAHVSGGRNENPDASGTRATQTPPLQAALSPSCRALAGCLEASPQLGRRAQGHVLRGTHLGPQGAANTPAAPGAPAGSSGSGGNESHQLPPLPFLTQSLGLTWAGP